MNSFRDKFYDKNDILVAVIVVIFALVLIAFKIDAIMEYPETLIATSQSEDERNNSESISVEIKDGESLNQIAIQLEKAEIISDAQVFADAVKNAAKQDSIKAGTYRLEKGMSESDIIKEIAE